jgi:hypothetical protein
VYRQAELFDRASKCQQAVESTTDPKDRETLRMLCGLWSNLANECVSMSDVQVAQEVAAIERIHAAVFGAGENKAAE